MKTTKRITDTAHGHTWDFEVLDPYTLHLVESADVRGRQSFMDLSNELWVFAVLDVTGAGTFFKTDAGDVPVPAGRYGFFKPPYGLTEISAECGRVTFTAILSKRPLPVGCPGLPVLWDIGQQGLPDGYDALFGLLATRCERVVVSRYGTGVSGIALKIKQLVEEHYREPVPLKELARKAGISQHLLSIYFKRDFHCTPSAYRKQLRIKASVLQLLECAETKSSVADIAFNCGYNDLSRYNKQFKAFTGVTPREVKT